MSHKRYTVKVENKFGEWEYFYLSPSILHTWMDHIHVRMQSPCALSAKNLTPTMWLPLKIIALLFLFPLSPPLCSCNSYLDVPEEWKNSVQVSFAGKIQCPNPRIPSCKWQIDKDKIVLLFDLLQIYAFDSYLNKLQYFALGARLLSLVRVDLFYFFCN